MPDADDQNPNDPTDRNPDDETLGPAGEGVTETHLHPTYEAMALRNELARQLEETLAGARAWARADGTDEARAIADALAEIYERLDETPEPY